MKLPSFLQQGSVAAIKRRSTHSVLSVPRRSLPPCSRCSQIAPTLTLAFLWKHFQRQKENSLHNFLVIVLVYFCVLFCYERSWITLTALRGSLLAVYSEYIFLFKSGYTAHLGFVACNIQVSLSLKPIERFKTTAAPRMERHPVDLCRTEAPGRLILSYIYVPSWQPMVLLNDPLLSHYVIV